MLFKTRHSTAAVSIGQWLDLALSPKAGWTSVPVSTQTPIHFAHRQSPSGNACPILGQSARFERRRRDDMVSLIQLASAPGSQSLIQLLPRLRDKSNIVVLSPTYGEHAAAWRAEGHDVAEISDIALVSNHADVVVVTNPNNPDGRVIASSTLLNLADKLAARGVLVVDEAFADAQPEASLAGNVGREGLIVLRSFGKFYGLAGLRLGFALAPKRVADEISVKLGPWSVAGPAIAISGEALADETWHTETRLNLAEAVKRLDNLLGSAGLTVAGGTPLFRFVTDPRSAGAFESLGRSGILVRHFPSNGTGCDLDFQDETAFSVWRARSTGWTDVRCFDLSDGGMA